MMKRSNRKRKNTKAPTNSTRAKGDIVEQIVASMHKNQNVMVERNVFLKTMDGSQRTREIDVLISTFVAGYPVNIPIECKNENKPIGVGKIDEFIGKLQDVGIPKQLGVFVSASGFTKGAITRANDAGIKTFLLNGKNNNLHRELIKAFQSIIYLLLSITNITITNNYGGKSQAHEMLFFVDSNGNHCGSIADLVWIEWVKRRIPEDLGKQKIKLNLPKDWFQIVNGIVVEVIEISVDILITGHVITIPGLIHQNKLINAASNAVEKWEIETSFENQPITLEEITFTSNEELQSFFHKGEGKIKLIVGNYRLPRIRWMALYWPPSESALRKLHELLHQSIENGSKFDITKLRIEDIEGANFQTIWDPIIENYPPMKLLEKMPINEEDKSRNDN